MKIEEGESAALRKINIVGNKLLDDQTILVNSSLKKKIGFLFLVEDQDTLEKT